MGWGLGGGCVGDGGPTGGGGGFMGWGGGFVGCGGDGDEAMVFLRWNLRQGGREEREGCRVHDIL